MYTYTSSHGAINSATIKFIIIGAGIEIVSSGPVSGFFLVTCVGTVPGITNVNDVDIQFSTVNDRAGMQPDTNRMGNPRFERAIFFSSLQPSDSGTYTCRVLVNGAQVIAETFVIDVECE